jgi:uncharacterized protein (DUF302 family)
MSEPIAFGSIVAAAMQLYPREHAVLAELPCRVVVVVDPELVRDLALELVAAAIERRRLEARRR